MRNWISSLIVLMIVGDAVALDYEKDIMPIFVKKCSDCHSASEGKVKGGFKVDDPAHLLGRLSKNNLVVPGDWDASYLFITLYRPADHDDAMPPEGKGERLTPEEVELVQLWITEGAPINGVSGDKGEMPASAETGAMTEVTQSSELAAPRQWINREGKAITATLLRVEEDVALLRIANGTVYRYPVENLSDESRAALVE